MRGGAPGVLRWEVRRWWGDTLLSTEVGSGTVVVEPLDACRVVVQPGPSLLEVSQQGSLAFLIARQGDAPVSVKGAHRSWLAPGDRAVVVAGGLVIEVRPAACIDRLPAPRPGGVRFVAAALGLVLGLGLVCERHGMPGRGVELSQRDARWVRPVFREPRYDGNAHLARCFERSSRASCLAAKREGGGELARAVKVGLGLQSARCLERAAALQPGQTLEVAQASFDTAKSAYEAIGAEVATLMREGRGSRPSSRLCEFHQTAKRYEQAAMALKAAGGTPTSWGAPLDLARVRKVSDELFRLRFE